MIIINAGSETVGGTYKDARKEAERLLLCMKEDGITDIELLSGCTENEGRFEFTYKHKVTGKTGVWDLTGLEHRYKEKGYAFAPRIHWNESSCSSPEWKDFLPVEYELTVRRS